MDFKEVWLLPLTWQPLQQSSIFILAATEFLFLHIINFSHQFSYLNPFFECAVRFSWMLDALSPGFTLTGKYCWMYWSGNCCPICFSLIINLVRMYPNCELISSNYSSSISCASWCRIELYFSYISKIILKILSNWYSIRFEVGLTLFWLNHSKPD